MHDLLVKCIKFHMNDESERHTTSWTDFAASIISCVCVPLKLVSILSSFLSYYITSVYIEQKDTFKIVTNCILSPCIQETYISRQIDEKRKKEEKGTTVTRQM